MSKMYILSKIGGLTLHEELSNETAIINAVTIKDALHKVLKGSEDVVEMFKELDKYAFLDCNNFEHLNEINNILQSQGGYLEYETTRVEFMLGDSGYVYTLTTIDSVVIDH